MNRHAIPLAWCILFVALLLLSRNATERAGGAVSAPTPVPTLARPVYPASSRGERPAVLVVGALGRATATATASPTAISLSVRGGGGPVKADSAPPPRKAATMVSLGVFRISAYSDSPRNGTDGRGITFSGERTRWGVVAVDPAVIGLHSKLQIEGFGGTVFEAKDRGGAIIGRMVDVWHRTDAEALRFGVKEARVWRLSN